MMQITEDTPPDMLAGAMDLSVHLPTGRIVKMSVERSTPMMDLLVHITTTYHLQHSGHILQALTTPPSLGRQDKILPYKPNTPIGVLDIQHVRVAPKSKSLSMAKNSAGVPLQPFESTFRLQVHLPRNQLYVIRVSRNVYLADIMKKVCDEKKMDMMKYEFRHPGNLDEVLDPKLTLSDYQITEIYVIAKGTIGLSQAFSSNDIMALRKEEERRQLQARTGGGVFSLIFKRGKQSNGAGSLSSENRSISPSHSDDSRSITPPALQQQILSSKPQETVEKPKPPQRKRRVAPKPPQQHDQQRKNSTEKPASNISSAASDVSEADSHPKKSDSGLTVCHSRNSSDSSGYHEPSVLSDHCNASLQRRSKTSMNEVGEEICEKRTSGNLSNMARFSNSSASVAGRKKKAAPLPPSVVTNKTENVAPPPLEKASSAVDASVSPTNEKEASSKSTKRSSHESLNNDDNPQKNFSTNLEFVKSKDRQQPEFQVPTSPSRIDECRNANGFTSCIENTESRAEFLHEPNSKIVSNLNTPSDTLSFNSESAVSYNNNINSHFNKMRQPATPLFDDTPNIPIDHIETDLERYQSIDKIIEDINEIDWEYTIAPPPSEFRDTNPTSNHEKIVNGNSKLENDDCDSVVKEDSKQMLNTLTLESLEKRKSLVYNREISTSLKVAQESSNSNNMVSKRSSMLNELEEVIQNGGTRSLTRHVEPPTNDSSLPNFKISTYAEPKTKIHIFEDDKKKNEEEATGDDSVFKKPFEFSKCKSTSRNNFYVKRQNSDTITRSESFSSNAFKWKPQNPVQRSKSQVALNKITDNQDNKTDDCNLTKSNSLFDVSGLQSLEVMREIQNKLNTPSNSTEQLGEQSKAISGSNGLVFEKEKNLNAPIKLAEQKSTTNTKIYQYQGPPAINLSTWSERPKTKVSLKEDTDYRISSTKNNYTTIVSIKDATPSAQRNESCYFNVKNTHPQPVVKNNIPQSNHNSNVTLRKPLVNTSEKSIRPHSMAFEPEFDISRVPIVRAVELKKSVITNGRYSDIYHNTETVNYKNSENIPVQRVNSYVQNCPNVAGFRGIEVGNDNTPRSRKSWNVSNNFSTLPPKIKYLEPSDSSCKYIPNSNVPFSKSSLKRVESSRTVELRSAVPFTTNRVSNRYSTGSQFVLKEAQHPPPPPPMLHIKQVVRKQQPASCNGNSGDSRDELLNSIRNFGGLKGLRHVKA